jgi:predicted RNA polymerase sigma factor
LPADSTGPRYRRTRWVQILIQRGLAALRRAEALGGTGGPYALQAAITACHGRARTPEETDWPRLASLYEQLAALVRSPVVELNRAIAVSMAEGPAAGLALVDALGEEPALRGYRLLPSARRSAGQAGALCRGARRVRTRRIADPQRAPAEPLAGAGRRMHTRSPSSGR